MFDVMYSRYILTIAALIISIMVAMLYFLKPKINKKLEHKMFAYLIVINIISLISELVIMGGFWLKLPFSTCEILFRIRDYSLMIYFIFTMFYYYTASNNLQYKSIIEFIRTEKVLFPQYIITIIFIIVHMLLPYNEMTKYTFNYTFAGPAFSVTVLYCVVTTLYTLYLVIFKKKDKLSFLEKLSIIWLMFLMFVILGLQLIFTGANIMGLISSIYILGLYFLFENPDLELLDELNDLTTNIEKASSSKIEFLSNVSKEMISPMNTIAILSENVLNNRNFDNEKVKKEIDKIEASSKNFLEIVNNTLNISNVVSEKDALRESNYSLSSLLSRLNSETKEKMVNPKVQFIMDLDTTIPSNLHGDSNKIYQILANIINNSIKFTEVGKISFKLTKEIKGTEIILKFKISDTGYGIKKEDYGKIFKKYARLDEAIENGIEGTGLGLAVAKKYVDILGGNITFDSVHGAGTTFYIEIPQLINNMSSTLENVTENKSIEEQTIIIDCSNFRLLVVEDDPLNLEVTKRLLGRYGFVIDTCTNGMDCINKYKKGEKYDMILIDHEMPEISGIEVMRVIRKLKDYQAPPLVALTANAFTGSKEVYMKEGFDDYLAKPIEITELDSLVNRYFK